MQYSQYLKKLLKLDCSLCEKQFKSYPPLILGMFVLFLKLYLRDCHCKVFVILSRNVAKTCFQNSIGTLTLIDLKQKMFNKLKPTTFTK